MMLAQIGQPTPGQLAAEAEASRLGTAMSAIKWIAFGGGALFLYIAIRGRANNANRY